MKNIIKTIHTIAAVTMAAVLAADAADFVPDGRTGAAIQRAIDAAFAAGGGRVALERGVVYASGTIYMKSHVELNVPEGTVLLGGDSPDDYDDVDDPRIGRRPEKSTKVFIACLDAEDVAITGGGIVDGQGVRFYDVNTVLWKHFYAKPPHPRPRMVQFFNCRNVRFEDVTFKDSPGWTCWMRRCENFTADRVKIVGDQKMINNDGFHIDSCRHVRIRRCDLRTGDDCVIMRAIRTPGENVAICEDMVVEDCTLDSACQCIRLGCPSDGTIRNGVFRNLRMSGNNGIASVHPVRYLLDGEHGSCRMENIAIENCDIDAKGSAIVFSIEPGIELQNFGDVAFRDIRLKSRLAIKLVGTGDTLLRNVRFFNVIGTVCAETPMEMSNVEGVVFNRFAVDSGRGKKSPPAVNDSDGWERGLAQPDAAETGKKVHDLVIYGATPAGIAAAVQARKMGLEPILLEPTSRIGGLTTGGLGQTDIGNKAAFGGIARKFYQDIKAHYETDGAWKFQRREEYKPRGQSCWERGEDSMWTFEPSAALKVLEFWERDWALVIRRNERLDRSPGGVEKKNGRIVAIRTESGKRFAAKMFVDATYEGDLMAAAGVTYTVGREANSEYGETISGIQRALMKNHQLNAGVDPYVTKGDPSSGLLPGIERDVAAPDGAGDSRVQAYCFRMCLTDDPRNRIPFKKPDGYRELDYELLLRNLEAGPLDPAHNGMPWINSPMPNRKTDTNNRTGFSTDFIGGANRWPEASYAERDEIAAAHLKYQQGLMWTLANNPRVPDRIRNEVARWGTCRDEFVGERGDGWQNQLYVREARRMVGEYVMTEHECRGERVAPRPVALGAYGMDSHNCRRYVDERGFAKNEGNIEDYNSYPPGSDKPFKRFGPYPIDYGAIVPRRGECANLFVPVCLSASHMAFGSIRMEPVFFALGQVAGTAAAQAIAAGCAVQDVDYAKLRARLLKDGQRLGQ